MWALLATCDHKEHGNEQLKHGKPYLTIPLKLAFGAEGQNQELLSLI